MRRILTILSFPVALLLGMATVSAYEAHAINVTANVSNALNVSATAGTELGTPGDPANPLRWRTIPIDISLSNSFTGQARANTVDYMICAQPKPKTHPGDPAIPFDPLFHDFLWMGGASFIEFDEAAGIFHWIGPTTLNFDNTDIPAGITPPIAGVVCPTGAVGSLTNPGDITDTISLWLDVPAFQGVYNFSVDDAFDKVRDDAADCGSRSDTQPCVILPVPPANIAGTNLGLDLVVQVTDIRP